MKCASTLLLLASTTAVVAPYHHAMTGKILIRDFSGTANPMDRTPAQVIAFEKARGYIDGIKDATQGTAWCYAGNIKPAELNFELIDTIKAKPPKALAGSAAPLVLEALKAKYPCADRQGAKS